MSLFKNSVLISLLALSVFPAVSGAQAPPGYAANYSETITAARKEGKLVIYAATDLAAASPLIRDFQAMYTGIKIEYHDMNTTELYQRFISESADSGGRPMSCGARRWTCRSSS